MQSEHRKNLLAIFDAALLAVNGRHRVREYFSAHSLCMRPQATAWPRSGILPLRHLCIPAHRMPEVEQRREQLPDAQERPQRSEVYVVAIGKAASAMAQGAFEALGGQVAGALVITRQGYGDATLFGSWPVTLLEAGHPVPDQRSLQAGVVLLDFINSAPRDAEFVFLISGGASSLVEVLPVGITLTDLGQVNRWLLGSGLDIRRINRVRKSMSCIKGGRLAATLRGRNTHALLMCDVPSHDVADIGSGLLVADHDGMSGLHDKVLPEWVRILTGRAPPAPQAMDRCFTSIETRIIADVHDACRSAAAHARKLGYAVYVHEDLITGDAIEMGRMLANTLRHGAAGLYVWGGETTVQLPLAPGCGGRNQSLALAVAQCVAGCDDIVFLSAGSDGSDGSTEDAGAIVDGATIRRGMEAGLDARICLTQADAGTFLAASGDLIHTGPTGSNVMDLMLGLKTI